MIDAGLDRDRQQVFAVTEEEVAVIEAGDIRGYLALLSDDAVFMPQNVASKTGDDLRQRLRGFLDRVAIEYLRFAHGETVIRDDLACHAYTCSWTATPKSGGQPALMCFKGIHVLRRQPGGHWKTSRSIWNANPTSDTS
jgi:ketosteroid isomerase-like protein